MPPKKAVPIPETPEQRIVAPVPVPMTWNVGVSEVTPGVVRIVVQIHSATGRAIYFLEPGFARQVAQMITEASEHSPAAGLVVPALNMAELERIRRDVGAQT
jgi:hypothetical protein